MKYIRCAISLTDYPSRLKREILVREDIDLLSFGCVIMTSMKASYQYLFHIESGDTMYLPLTYLKGAETKMRKYIGDYFLSSLKEPFKLFYGNTENGYAFNVYPSSNLEILDGDRIAIIEKGCGIGIFEDTKDILYGHFDGKKFEDAADILLPWNLDIESIEDFDKPLDIESENELLDQIVLEDINRFSMMDSEYSDSDELEEADETDLLTIVNDQIEHLDFVKETYDRIRAEFGDDRAKSFIVSAMLNEVDMMVKEDREFSLDRYKEILRRL